MRRSKPTAAILLLTTVLGIGLAQGQQRDTRDLTGFDSIVARGVDISVGQGETFAVIVEADDSDDLAGLITEVDGTTLEIRPRRGVQGLFGWFGPDYSVAITLPRLESLTATGGADVEVDGVITGEALAIAASGGSDLRIAVEVTELTVRSSGGSDIDLSGTADAAVIDISGGSDVNGREFIAGSVNLSSSGGSDASFGVEERLAGRASGGSDIVYAGNPTVVDLNLSGGSDMRRR